MEKRKLQWHPAFGAALRITLKEEMEFLVMQEEYLLSKKPPQIDILIIKKLRDIPLRKAIDPEELTITFVCSHYPREMMKTLSEVRGREAEYREAGIY